MRQASREGGAALAARLRERRAEIEQATFTRVTSLSALPRAGGPEYAEGLRRAVAAALDCGLEGVERGDEGAPAIPEPLLSQARLAARSGVSLDTVLRRYLAGHAILDDFLIEEAERIDSIGPDALKRLLRAQAAIADRLLAAVAKTYTEEAERRPRGFGRQRAERVERLLDGEPLDTASLGYEFAGNHTALIAQGVGAEEAVRSLAAIHDSVLLPVHPEDGVLWAWLGSRRPLCPGELQREAEGLIPPGLTIALGESGEGIAGWRLSHQQARAALSVALRSGENTVRYADVALLATVIGDELLAASLRSLLLDPLAEGPDQGLVLFETLRAYFAAERSVSSTAAALGVTRQTVSNRLRGVEDRLGRPLARCGAEMEAALRLESMEPDLSVRPFRQENEPGEP
jgi:PucR C-terminal helix-turn-helix domain/GGDEF-like domain